MRISFFSGILLLSALVGSVHADRKDAHTGLAVATLGPAHARDRGTPALTTGDLTLTAPVRSARRAPFLTAGEVTASVAPRGPEIEHCYLDRAGDTPRGGHLDLTLVIARDGSVVSVQTAATGLPARTARKVEVCIREIIEAMQFPPRRNDTTAVVPYLFQKTSSLGAGPVESCWSPTGC